ncbi:MAG: YlmC/YmxH family sporulation protein [Clostridiales bacterium]|nr:YlmC/YmxH family sporulation protein [Clostridiales bacterium]
MESSFLELRCKEVINVTDGKKLGHIIDIVFDLPSGKIKGLVVPINQPGFNLFKQPQHLFIPYNQICKIGDDIILVELYEDNIQANIFALNAPKKKK